MNAPKSKITFYLAGAMEAAKDLGAGWREVVTKELDKLNMDVLNPCLFEPAQLRGLQPNRLPDSFIHKVTGKKVVPKHWHELKNSTDSSHYNRFLKYMRRIISYDIRILQHKTDFVIVLWNDATGKGAGTHAELTYAYLKNIPVYCVQDSEMPAWADACVTERFENFEKLFEFLKDEFGE